MIQANIKRVKDKSLISHTEVARLFEKKPEDMVRAIGNLTLAAPETAKYFQLTCAGEYLMEKDGFMILTSGISGQKAFMAKMEVVKALEKKSLSNDNNGQLTIIDEREVLGKHFCMYGTFDDPMFMAKDVAEWIDYTKTSQGYYNVSMMLKPIDDNEKVTISIVDSDGKPHKQWLLTEDGLYEVLMQSRKPIAKAFKKQVKEILKSIRKTGAYIAPGTTPMDNDGKIQKLLQQNEQMIAYMEKQTETMQMQTKSMTKQTEMINCLGKLTARMAQSMKVMADGITKLASLPAPAQKPEQIELLPQTVKVHDKCITISMAAEKFGFFTHRSGKPNARVMTDILKYGCGIKLYANWGRDDEYVVVRPTTVGEDVIPCVWLKPAAIEKVEEYLSSDKLSTVLHSQCYKRAWRGKLKGEWKCDMIQYVGRNRHILADRNGNYCKYAA